MSRPVRLLFLFLLACAGPPAGPAVAETFHVAPGGSDAADGLTPETAFATVEHACDAAAAAEDRGGHVVKLAPGEYPLARAAVLKSRVALVGADRPWNRDDPDAARFSVLLPGPGWAAAETPGDNAPDQYLLRAEKHAAGVTVRNVRFRGARAEGEPPVVTGAVHADQAAGLTLEGLTVDRFRLCGFRLLYCENLRVAGCRLTDAALEKDGPRWGAAVWTAWPKNSVLEDCRIAGARSGGYGIKGGGSDGFRVTRCVVEGPYFSLEHPHENEFGLEIDHCRFDGCISVPKGGPQTDPAERGHARSVHIHHNYLTDSYTVEGPRQYLEFAYNHVHVERTGGRCYTQHGGSVPGPALIHHNVFENVDRACVWMNEGYAGGIHFFNNTVFAADAGGRSGFLFDSYAADRLDDWRVANNLFAAAWTRPRALLPDRNGVPGKIAVGRNLYQNVIGAPPGSADGFPANLLTRAGEKPAPFYRPGAGSPAVDAGEDVGLPFAGAAPDLGAVEFVPAGSDFIDPWADWSVPKE